MPQEATKEYPYEIVRGTFFEHDVPISKMFVDFRTHPGGYARPLKDSRVDKLVADWDRQAVGVLLLSMREDGSFATIDGHHRWQAALRLGIESLDALVFIDLTLEDEARLYRKYGDYLKQSPLDKYHAAITEGVKEYLAIDRVVRSFGLVVPNALGSTKNTVDAVDALLHVAKTYGLELLQQTLGLIHDPWDGEHRAYQGQLMRGAAMFLARFGKHKNYKRARLIDRMAREGVSNVEKRARAFRDANLAGNPASAYGQALLYLHDRQIAEDKVLGDWPRKLLTEQNAEAQRQRFREMNANLTPEQKTARAIKAQATLTPEARTQRAVNAARTKFGFTARSVPCSYCYAEAQRPCINKDTGEELKYLHAQRRAAAKKWAEGKLKP
jgi:hypothetical protein